jgi:cytochrome c
MAGPVYYSDLYPAETRYPSYYDGKFFFYEWIRGFIKPVTMLPNGDYDRMEPFMENTKFHSPIDMELGPDGRLYLLEYGTGWFQKNADAGIVRIDYNGGNRPPKISSITIDKETGDLPFTVKAKVVAKDPEKEPMKYTWNFGDGQPIETTVPEASVTYKKPGDYAISVEVKDAQGATVKSDVLNVYAGNEQPTVSIEVLGNKSFYFPGKEVKYVVKADDKDDTASARQLTGLYVSADYMEGFNKAAVPLGHQQATAIASGENLMLSYDCKTCHKVAEKSIGPAFTQVAAKYPNNQQSIDYLINKVKKGGGGVWGETMMAAHPNIAQSDITTIVQWILSLGHKTAVKPSLASTGAVNPTLGKPANDKAALVLSASYTDKGGPGIKPLTGSNTYVLRSTSLDFVGVTNKKSFETYDGNGMHLMIVPKTTGWFSVDHIDLTDIKSGMMMVAYQVPPAFGFQFELHLDAPDGKLLGTFDLTPPPANGGKAKPINFQMLSAHIDPVTDGKFHDLYIVSKSKNEKNTDQVAIGSLKLADK